MDSSEHFAFRAGSSPLYAKGIVFTKKRLRNMMLIDTALTAPLRFTRETVCCCGFR